MMTDPFTLGLPFIKVGDIVCLAKSDGDGHFISREDNGEVVAVNGREKIEVAWENGDVETLHEDHLDMV